MSAPNAPEDPKPAEGSALVPPPPSWSTPDSPAPEPEAAEPVEAAPSAQEPAADPWGSVVAPEPPAAAEPAPAADPWQAPAAPAAPEPPAAPAPAAADPWQTPAAPAAPASPYGAAPQPPSAYPSAADAGFPPAPTPPASGFPQAPGFPPAPAASYGTPAAGYGTPGGFQAPVEATAAFGWGWNKFTQNWGVLVLANLIWGIGVGLVILVGYLILIAIFAAGANANGEVAAGLGALGLVGFALLMLVGVFAGFLAQLGLTNGYLTVVDGRTPTLKDFFVFRNIGAGVVASILIALASFLGSFVFVGSILVVWLALFVIPFVVDRNLSAIDAIKASIQVTTRNAGQTILLYVLTAVAAGVGSLLCGVGILVALPVAGLATAWMYRKLTGGVAAA